MCHVVQVIQAHLATTSGAYTGIMDVVQQLVKRDGYRSLFRSVIVCKRVAFHCSSLTMPRSDLKSILKQTSCKTALQSIQDVVQDNAC